MTRVLVFLVVSCCLALSLQGAVVVLKNGDRISGVVLSKDNDYLQLESPVLGSLRIALGQVDRIEEDVPGETQMASRTDSPPSVPVIQRQGDNVGPATEEIAEAAAATGLQTEALAEAVESKRIEERLRSFLFDSPILGTALNTLANTGWVKNWKSSLTFGLLLRSGATDSTNYNLQFWTERKTKVEETRLETNYDYETARATDGTKTVTRDRLRVQGRYRYNLEETFFLQSNTQYSYAHVSGIDHDFRQSLGVGWRYLNSKRLQGSITPSVTAQYQEVWGETEGISMAPTIYQELVYNMSERITFREETNAMFPMEGRQDPTYGLLLRMETKLMTNLAFHVEYDFDYDGAVIANPSQTNIRARIGITF